MIINYLYSNSIDQFFQYPLLRILQRPALDQIQAVNNKRRQAFFRRSRNKALPLPPEED